MPTVLRIKKGLHTVNALIYLRTIRRQNLLLATVETISTPRLNWTILELSSSAVFLAQR